MESRPSHTDDVRRTKLQQTLRSHVSLMRWPGEWRFVGGRQFKGDQSPLETAAKHMLAKCPGLQIPSRQHIRATLLYKSAVMAEDKDSLPDHRLVFHVYKFILFLEENDFMATFDPARINKGSSWLVQIAEQKVGMCERGPLAVHRFGATASCLLAHAEGRHAGESKS